MKHRGFWTNVALAAGLIAVASQADAQRASPGFQSPGAQSQAGRNQPGDFDYYALVMSWSPTYCAGEGAGRNEPQCAPNRPYAFVLHGLWPQYTRGFPGSCRTAFDPFVPQPVINGILDIMPSRNLVIHEYRKHGTCSGLEPKAYFDTSRKLFDKIKIPEQYRSLDRPLVTNIGDVTKAFVAANPGMKPDMMGIACKRPNRLQEIRFCFSKEGELKSCGSNEKQSRLCSSPNLYLPPVRASSAQRGWFRPRPAAPSEPAAAPEGARKI